jgi:hypothetical protein
MPKRGVRDERKAAQWARIIEQQRRSGKSIAAFCRKRGVSLERFHWWQGRQRRQEGREEAAGSAGFVELVTRGEETAFSGVELRVGDRVGIRVSRGFDPETLGSVLRVVDSAAR